MALSFIYYFRTIEDCVSKNLSLCDVRTGSETEMLISYFCGQEDFCR